jgi:hypothetical protein
MEQECGDGASGCRKVLAIAVHVAYTPWCGLVAAADRVDQSGVRAGVRFVRDNAATGAGPGTMPVQIISILGAIIAAMIMIAHPLADEARACTDHHGNSAEAAETCTEGRSATLGVADAGTSHIIRADVSGTLAQAAGGTIDGISNWLKASYQRAPALVLGLAALLIVPPLAFLGSLFRSRERPQDVDVTYLATRMAAGPIDAGEGGESLTARVKAPAWPSEAWIMVDGEGADGVRHGIGRTLVRIGRESDNDIRLTDKTVHRYHAAIHRTEDAEFVITDLSSAGGNGVTVNGRAVAEARLSDGDSIELGHAKLKFVARPA